MQVTQKFQFNLLLLDVVIIMTKRQHFTTIPTCPYVHQRHYCLLQLFYLSIPAVKSSLSHLIPQSSLCAKMFSQSQYKPSTVWVSLIKRVSSRGHILFSTKFPQYQQKEWLLQPVPMSVYIRACWYQCEINLGLGDAWRLVEVSTGSATDDYLIVDSSFHYFSD